LENPEVAGKRVERGGVEVGAELKWVVAFSRV